VRIPSLFLCLCRYTSGGYRAVLEDVGLSDKIAIDDVTNSVRLLDS